MKRWKCKKCRCVRVISVQIVGSGSWWAVGGSARFCIGCRRELTPAEVAHVTRWNVERMEELLK